MNRSSLFLILIGVLNCVKGLEQDELNDVSMDTSDYYDQAYVESEELPKPKGEFPEIFCNTRDEIDEDNHIFVTSCTYATSENMHLYQHNQFFLPNERHLTFSYSDIEYINRHSFNSDDPLALAFNIKVTVLDLQHVNLQDLEPDTFSTMKNLEDLNLCNNKLTSIPGGVFNSLNKLAYLDLSQNRLSGFLDWRNLTGLGGSLSNLDLSGNKIKFIRKHALFNLTGLETLNLSSNKIAILPGLLFHSNPFLTNIYLSNNSINIIGSGTFGYLNKISTLDLSQNRIVKLPYSIFQTENTSTEVITYFNIQDNHLEKISEIIERIEIKDLFIQNNNITNITGGMFCDKLDVRYMGLKVLSNISMCGRGSAILASHNQLQDIPNMFDVNLVSVIELQYNNITHLPAGRFSEFSRLISLRLDKNHLRKIEIGLFTNLDNLKSLNISFNNLDHVNQKIFYGLWRLENLYLGGNHLKSLPAVMILQSLRSLKLLGLNHNPWECGELMEILHVLDMNNIQMAHHVRINYHTTNIGGVECKESHEMLDGPVAKLNLTEVKTTLKPNNLEITTENFISQTTVKSVNTTVKSVSTSSTSQTFTVNENIATDKPVIVLGYDEPESTTDFVPVKFIPTSEIIVEYSSKHNENADTFTEQTIHEDSTDSELQEAEYSAHYRNREETPQIQEEMASMKSSIYEMRAVLIIGTILIACMICMKLYNFYRKNIKTHIITSTIHENSVQSITTEIEM